jgi:16S rRNA (adenine1518-N6/adenine1519-N6)-dimethyltransferase
MDLLDKARFLLRKYGIRPRRSIGQSFCVDSSLLRRMVNYSAIDEEDVVLEVGAGFGFLTRILSEVSKEVIAVELDHKLVKALKEILRDKENIQIVEGDCLNVHLPRFSKVVANPPYSISSPLVLNLLGGKFECAVLTLQREFVEKLTAQRGSRTYGSLAVIAHYSAAVKALEDVPRRSFYPHPNVDSTVVLIKPQKPLFEVGDEGLFFKIVRSSFTQRNRKLRNFLKVFIRNELKVNKGKARMLVEDFPYLESRVYDLTPEEFGEISCKIHRIFVKRSSTRKSKETSDYKLLLEGFL